jgi:hypothetical protein
MHKKKCKGQQHNELSQESSGRMFFSKFTSPLWCTASRHSTPPTTGTADRWEKYAAPSAASSATKEIQKTGLSV